MKTVLFALNGSYSHTNLAVRAIGVSLRNAGEDVVLIEKNLKDTRLCVLETLVSENADVYGFSTYIWNVAEMLDFAASRKIVKAHWYLADWYTRRQDYAMASDSYGEFIDNTKDDSLRIVAQQRMNHCDRLHRMVRNAEVVCFVDSVVVDKNTFLAAYNMGNDS